MRYVPLWHLLVRDSSNARCRGIKHLSTGTVRAYCLLCACVAHRTTAQGKGTEGKGYQTEPGKLGWVPAEAGAGSCLSAIIGPDYGLAAVRVRQKKSQ